MCRSRLLALDCRSFSSLQGIVIALMNTYGLCYVVIYLGFGLVELPVW